VDAALGIAGAARDEARRSVATHVTAPMEAVICDTIVDATVPEMVPVDGEGGGSGSGSGPIDSTRHGR
jgi:hypothetical protein